MLSNRTTQKLNYISALQTPSLKRLNAERVEDELLIPGLSFDFINGVHKVTLLLNSNQKHELCSVLFVRGTCTGYTGRIFTDIDESMSLIFHHGFKPVIGKHALMDVVCSPQPDRSIVLETGFRFTGKQLKTLKRAEDQAFKRKDGLSLASGKHAKGWI